MAVADFKYYFICKTYEMLFYENDESLHYFMDGTHIKFYFMSKLKYKHCFM